MSLERDTNNYYSIIQGKLNAKVIFAIILLVLICVFMFFYRPKVLGNMSNRFREMQTSCSDFSFEGTKGERIKISLRTSVANGTVDFVLTDSKGNLVLELDRAKALETYIDIDHDDTYTMTAIYHDFIGDYSIKVRTRR